MRNVPPRLTAAEAALYLGVTPKTLAKWRSTGQHNIPYLKFGAGRRAAVRYDKFSLDEFLDRCRSHNEEGVAV